ncbi:hypothetical protein BC831DRAFT_489115 [Entophlyctis helioformis]|nr:hypothetical protein BC831DRAFT_489115 [Entophlyctis helioformis]
MSLAQDVAALFAVHPVPTAVVGLLAAGSFLYSSFLLSSLLPLLLRAALPVGTPSAQANPRLSVAAGSWAVVTGASDGIGKEFALELAKLNFNVVLISRSRDKLEAVADLARKAASSEIDVLVYPFDFSTADKTQYSLLKAALARIDVGLLVNNVAMNHAFPVPFIEEDEALVEAIVQVDVVAQLRMTRMVLPQMIARKAGSIINIGSMAGRAPSAYLAPYSGSKAFIRSWSQGVGMEVYEHGVHVEHVNTYFVTTAMSKIRKPSFMAPTPNAYVRAVLCNLGQSMNSTPYPSHAIIDWVIDRFIPEWFLTTASASMHLDIRKRALKKQAREQNKKTN